MHRIDGYGATNNNLFTEGDPASAVPATQVTGDWLNGVQEELVAVVEAAGISPQKGQWGQVLQAIQEGFGIQWRHKAAATGAIDNGDGTYTITGISGDQTPEMHAGRRLKASGALTGTAYATIISSAFSTTTSVTVRAVHGASGAPATISNEALTCRVGMMSAGPGHSTPWPWVSVRGVGTLAHAVAALGATRGTIVVDADDTIAADLTVPETATLLFMSGALAIAETVTLPVDGPLPAGAHQIFVGAGAVTGFGRVRNAMPEWWGAAGDGVTDDKAAVQAAIGSGATRLLLDGTYLVSGSLDFSAFSGEVSGTGEIAAKSGVAFNPLVQFGAGSNIRWSGVSLDMGQTAATAEADDKCEIGFKFLDARNIRVSDVNIENIRIGRPIFVGGTSSNSSVSTDGSKHIYFERITCVAFEYATIDEGTYCIVRSDFYTTDTGGTHFHASNGVKTADYLLDDTVAYDRTTEHVFFTDCFFENHDRMTLLNCRDVHFSNVVLRNFYTRGLTLSPNCEDVTWNGGHLSGGAAQFNANYACKNIVVNGASLGGGPPVGQKHTLRCGYGTTDVVISNVSGVGCADRHLFIEACKRITYSGCTVTDRRGGPAVISVSLNAGGGGESGAWVTENINIIGCALSANYGIRINENVSTNATLDLNSIVIQGCQFITALSLWNNLTHQVGKIRWANNYVSNPGGEIAGREFRFVLDVSTVSLSGPNAPNWTVAKNGIGDYTVTHNLGLSSGFNLMGAGTVRAANGYATIDPKGGNVFDVSIFDAAGARQDQDVMLNVANTEG